MNFFKKNQQNNHILLYNLPPDYKKIPPQSEALYYACIQNNFTLVKKLINNHVNPNFVWNYNSFYRSPLVQTLQLQTCQLTLKIIYFLLSLESIELNIYSGENFQVTPFLAAAINGAPLKLLKIMIEKGADINHHGETYHWGQTALIISSINGDIETTRFLLDHHANTNITDIYGYTALMRATEKNHLNIVKLLLNAGTKVNHRANDGMTALLLAGQNQNKGIINLLQKFGAKII